jgi:FAD/FMN-containing dehydrogenase
MMAAKNTRAEKIAAVDLRQMNRVLELTPEDMTVTVESGIMLGALQRELARHGQWLPIDPPNAEGVSIREVLSKDLSGPRRFGYGTIREHLIGMKVVLADGRIIKSGGKVVKNVAGYDLAKLFIGARDSLGIIVEATFKLRPSPAMERFVCRAINDLGEAKAAIRAMLDSALTPVILDASNAAQGSALAIVLGFAGTRAEVDWQLGLARALGFERETNLDYEMHFWDDAVPVNRLSILPSRLTEAIADLGSRPFVARAGNGAVYYRGERIPQKAELPLELARRIKTAYDPKNILPELMA